MSHIGQAQETHDAHDDHHITPWPKLAGVFILLTVLMIITVVWALVAEKLPQSPGFTVANNVIAMSIAVAKAYFVIMIFMGVKYTSNVVKTYAILGFAWVGLMTIVFVDYASRRLEPVRGWSNEPTLAMPRADEPAEIGQPPRSEMKLKDPHEEGAAAAGEH